MNYSRSGSVPLYLAPMVTLTHAGLRHLIAEFGGCDRYYTEMISAEAITAHSAFHRWYLDLQPEPERTVYQFLFRDAAAVKAVATKIAGRGALGIDLNMACSAPHIVRAGGGIAWMKRVDEARRAVAAAREVLPDAHLSVKLRLGERREIEQLARFAVSLCAAGAGELTLHPKTRKEPEARPADWRFVAELQQRVAVPVVASGGVSDITTLEYRIRRYEPRAVMIGREAVRSPWIFALARNAQLVIDRLAVARRFGALLREHQPPEFQLTRAKRFYQYYTQPLQWGTRLFAALKTARSMAEIEQRVGVYFAEHPQDRYPEPSRRQHAHTVPAAAAALQ